jgi:hypothetical protein
MPPIALDDEALTALRSAAAPLAPWQRNLFLKLVAHELEQVETIGAGVVDRVAKTVQRRILRGDIKPARFRRRAD